MGHPLHRSRRPPPHLRIYHLRIPILRIIYSAPRTPVSFQTRVSNNDMKRSFRRQDGTASPSIRSRTSGNGVEPEVPIPLWQRFQICRRSGFSTLKERTLTDPCDPHLTRKPISSSSPFDAAVTEDHDFCNSATPRVADTDKMRVAEWCSLSTLRASSCRQRLRQPRGNVTRAWRITRYQPDWNKPRAGHARILIPPCYDIRGSTPETPPGSPERPL